jgi:membrane fusion protein (multidrug efflux system)
MIGFRQIKEHFLGYSRRVQAVIIIACLVVVWLIVGGTGSKQDESKIYPPVEVFVVESKTLSDTITGLGTLKAIEVVSLRPEVSGQVKEIHFIEGKPVSVGQLLFEIDDQKLRHQLLSRQAALQASIARFENAEKTHQRFKRLHGKKLVSDDEFDKANADFEAARAEMDRLQQEVSFTAEQLSDTRIVAPIAGVISERMVDRGDYVNIGQELAIIYKDDKLEAVFNIPERYMGQVSISQPVEISVDAYRDRKFKGSITFISPAINEGTRNLLLKATVANNERLLKHGSFVNVAVTVDHREQRPVVPEESLVATRQGYLLFVLEDGVVRVQDVQTGLRQNGLVEVVSGVKVGQKVVRSGHLRLSGGEKVTVIKGSDGNGAQSSL